MPLDEDNVKSCLQDFIESDYGKTMFGRHDTPASYGITGDLEFVELQGPEVILTTGGNVLASTRYGTRKSSHVVECLHARNYSSTSRG